MTDLLTCVLLLLASALFYGSDRSRGMARFQQPRSPSRTWLARWVACAALAVAVGFQVSQGTSLPVMVLMLSAAFMVTLTLVTLTFSILSPANTPTRSSAPLVRRGAPSSKMRASVPHQSSWRARADIGARTLAAVAGPLLAAFFCAAALMRWLPGQAPTRFAVAMLLAIPLWVLGMCLGFVATSALRTWIWCGATSAGLAVLLRWMD